MTRYTTVTDLSPAALSSYDTIIDVRSPAEFADDRLPGAINLPVLDNEERAEIGTTYKQNSSFLARRAGAALISRNIGAHLDTALSDKPKDFKPLVYCWRGGMRSESMATILSAIGWRTSLIQGGYKTWRRTVVAALDHDTPDLPIILIDGQTGTAKTALLAHLRDQGGQVIDLEGLARHRGSAFGEFVGDPQPSQKWFETLIWAQLREMDMDRPIYVEAESHLVGKRRIPRRLWASMLQAPSYQISAPLPERARHIITSYEDLISDESALQTAIDRLRGHHSNEKLATWKRMACDGAFEPLTIDLIRTHYDPAYVRSRKSQLGSVMRKEVSRLDRSTLADLASHILDDSQ